MRSPSRAVGPPPLRSAVVSAAPRQFHSTGSKATSRRTSILQIRAAERPSGLTLRNIKCAQREAHQSEHRPCAVSWSARSLRGQHRTNNLINRRAADADGTCFNFKINDDSQLIGLAKDFKRTPAQTKRLDFTLHYQFLLQKPSMAMCRRVFRYARSL